MDVYQLLVVLLIAVSNASAVDLPPDFKKCTRANANECLKGFIQDSLSKLANGLQEFNLPPLQPLTIPSVSIGEKLGSINLHQAFNQLKIYNIPFAKVVKTSINFDDKGYNISVKLFFDNITAESEYILKGRLLLLPIEGSGACQVWIGDVIAQVDLVIEEVKRKGLIYGMIKDIKIDLSPKQAGFYFDGLFGGNKQLANEMNKVLNENGLDVWNEVKLGYEMTAAFVFKDYLNKIFKKIPSNKLFI